VSEAVAFFKKRNPNVITGMIALLEHIGAYSSYYSSLAHQTTGKKEPPKIVTNRPSETEITTD